MKTAKPTDNELEIAIVAAEQRLDSGQDDHHLAMTLLYLYQRQQDLERIRGAAERLLRSARDESRLTSLSEAIEIAHSNEVQRSG